MEVPKQHHITTHSIEESEHPPESASTLLYPLPLQTEHSEPPEKAPRSLTAQQSDLKIQNTKGIHNNDIDQFDLINTFYHEFTHFIVDIVLNEDNYNKYFPNNKDAEKIDVELKSNNDVESNQDMQEEKLCTQVANKCTALVKKQLNVLP